MNKAFWDYCAEVENILPANQNVSPLRMILEDVEAVAHSFDKRWAVIDCAETIMERRDVLKLNAF